MKGAVTPDEGEWQDWLLKVREEARSEIVAVEAPGAKSAALHYRVLQRLDGGTLLEIEGAEDMDVPAKMAECYGKLESAGVAAEEPYPSV